MSIICDWLWNPVLGTKEKRQVFCIGICDSEIWMERCRLNWCISHPLWSLPPLQSQSGSYHTQMWQISFLRCQKFKVWLLKSKHPWTIVSIFNRHFTQFSLTESMDWRLPLFLEIRLQISEPTSTSGRRIHKYLTRWAQKSSSSSDLQWMRKKQMQETLQILTGLKLFQSLVGKKWF